MAITLCAAYHCPSTEVKMKILISGSFWHGSLEESYAQAFESIGWTVFRFDWDQHAQSHPLAQMAFCEKLLRTRIADGVGKRLLSEVQTWQPDLLLIIKGKFVDPVVLREAKKILGDRPSVNFNPDSPWERENSSSRLLRAIPEYDAHFTWNSHLISRFLSEGAKSATYLPFAHDPTLHFPVPEREGKARFDAVFAGTCSAQRDKLLSRLVGCKIAIWGNGWDQSRLVPREWLMGKAVYGEDSTRLLALAPVALNILRPQNDGSHNMRTFEIPATRHTMLTTRSNEQSLLFAEGMEMECFASPAELEEKILALNRDPDRARQIALAGYERVREETYAKRARTMLDVLGFAK